MNAEICFWSFTCLWFCSLRRDISESQLCIQSVQWCLTYNYHVHPFSCKMMQLATMVWCIAGKITWLNTTVSQNLNSGHTSVKSTMLVQQKTVVIPVILLNWMFDSSRVPSYIILWGSFKHLCTCKHFNLNVQGCWCQPQLISYFSCTNQSVMLFITEF